MKAITMKKQEKQKAQSKKKKPIDIIVELWRAKRYDDAMRRILVQSEKLMSIQQRNKLRNDLLRNHIRVPYCMGGHMLRGADKYLNDALPNHEPWPPPSHPQPLFVHRK